MKIDISVVIPIFNEEKNITQLYKRLKFSLNQISHHHEVIFIDDGSQDKSWKLLKNLRMKDRKIKLISFSRNFGHMSALQAGLIHAHGKKVVIMDADLQDPPETIIKMYRESKKGFEVVYGIKQKRKEGWQRKVLFLAFYRVLNYICPYKMPLDAGTFSLIDQKVVKILVSLPERNKYFSGLRAWTGFSQTGITYERAARSAGKQASLSRLLKLALDGMFSFSYIPLKLASYLGFISAILAFIFIIFVAVLRIFFGVGIVGWASTMSTTLLMGGVQLITLGIIGEYLARIYDEVKSRPQYVISEKFGL